MGSNLYFYILGLLGCSLPSVFSWGGHGHLTVARIAYDYLSANYASVLDAANKELAVLTASDPGLVYKENDYPFVECATLADDIKYNGGSWQSDWHYVDNPFLDQGGNINDYPSYFFTV